jgi:hypothetical protein
MALLVAFVLRTFVVRERRARDILKTNPLAWEGGSFSKLDFSRSRVMFGILRYYVFDSRSEHFGIVDGRDFDARDPRV